VHDEKSDESSFTMIMKSEILDSEEYDSNRLNSTEKAIHQAVEKEIDLAKLYEHSLSRQKMLSKKKKIVLK